MLRFFACLLFAAIAGPAAGQVIISEIMYNPDSNEGGVGSTDPCQTEWLEIYNAGDEAVSLAGWYLQDEDGRTEAMPDNTVIEPGQAIVLIPGAQSVTDFRAAWGRGFTVIKLDGWTVGNGTLDNLSNGPSDTNEVLTLVNADDEVVDEVNYDDEEGWPSDSPDGASIVLIPDELSAEGNDEGASWTRSTEGQLGARANRQTDEYDGEDVGSPGTVATE